MLLFLSVAVMLAVGYAFLREGLLTSLTMLVNVFFAGLVAFNFFEPLADALEPMFAGSFLANYEDAVSLFGLFALVLGLLRLLAHNLANTELGLHPLAQQVGSVCVGLLTGYLLAGFLACMAQTLPLDEKFLGFDYQATPTDPPMRHLLPADRVWLALMSRASGGPLAQGTPSEFDPEGTFELRYARRRIKEQAGTPAAP